jgi:riboflavin kinase / FMN adenylyltransferase
MSDARPHYVETLEELAARVDRPVVTIGNFDGLHLGHQAIFADVTRAARAAGTQSVAISFHPHPVVFFGKRSEPEFLINSPEQKLELSKAAGIDHALLLPFSRDLAGLTPEDFVHKVLHEALGAQSVWVGYDFNFGKGRTGTTDDLRRHAEDRGILVHVHDAVRFDGEVVSSTRVRRALTAGEFELAHALLGREHTLRGAVVVGDQRGRELGFPTANIFPRAGMMIPHGIYVSTLISQGHPYPAVTSVGVRPTIAQDLAPNVETYVLDRTDLELYGKTVDVTLHKWLRPELRFDSLDALRAAINADCDAARAWHTP